jgi:microcystin-dependent protein
LIGFITSMLDGEGIVLNISSNDICLVVSKYLVECETLNLPNVINALLKGLCETYQVAAGAAARIGALDEAYNLQCVTGVTADAGIRNVLQATITKLCSVDAALTALALNVSTNYVSTSTINSYIAAYLASIGTSANYSNKMVPYTVVEYYGSLAGFDVTGKGTGLWDKIYLCNGNNGTPDKRGRVPVGATTGMGGGAMNSAVDPAVAGNPSYALLGTAGANTITLSVAQMPAHTHVATVTIVDPGHTHTILGITGGDNNDNNNTVRFAGGDKVQGESSFYFNNTEACQSAPTGLNNTNVSVSNASTGGGLAHNNYQPALGCYYIMYIP